MDSHPASIVEIEDFLEWVVEGYLFKDLAALKPSGVGYPWLMTSFGGIELLGTLVSPEEFDRLAGRQRFVSYWANCLYPKMPKSTEQGLALYKLVRHGIAHLFIPKGPIHVAGDNDWRHLTVDPVGNLFVDPKALADDLVASYWKEVKPLLSTTAGSVNRNTLNQRLQEILAAAAGEAADMALATIFPARPPRPEGTPLGVTATKASSMSERLSP